jgi:hypothetical protein
MQRIKAVWTVFKNVAIVLSFVVNLILIVGLLILATQLYALKNNLLEPLIGGLYSSFAGLDSATIDRIIPVRDSIPISFTLPLEQNTSVRLTAPVPLQANAQFVLPGGGGNINGSVSIVLPEGLDLPVSLDLDVPVNTTVPVSLNVRALIPLRETQLHDAFVNLALLLQPFVRILDNLPGNADEGQSFLNQMIAGLRGEAPLPDLLAPTTFPEDPWPGFSRTAGDGYLWPADAPPQPGQYTGTQPGGLTAWDVPEGAPDGVYRQSSAGMAGATGGPLMDQTGTQEAGEIIATPIPTGPPPEGDLGILPTPAPG